MYVGEYVYRVESHRVSYVYKRIIRRDLSDKSTNQVRLTVDDQSEIKDQRTTQREKRSEMGGDVVTLVY